jgi:SAM-dependent methyltransferase
MPGLADTRFNEEDMSLIQKIYSVLHRAATPGGEGGSSVSPGYWNHLVRSRVLSAVRDIKGTILDVGCGDGLFLIHLAKQNPDARIWAVDIDGANIKQAQERVNNEKMTSVYFSHQDATMLSFDPGMFDVILCTNVFMTMDSMATVRKALASMARVSKKGALIFFDYRNALNPLLRLKYKLAPLYDGTIKGRNLSAFFPGDIADALKEADIAMISRQCIGLPFLRPLAPVIIVKARKV